jgi:hypothetical protein
MKYSYAKRHLQSIADGGFSSWMEKNNYWKPNTADLVFKRIYKEVIRMENEMAALRKRGKR